MFLFAFSYALFPALSVCRNMAELNVHDPSFWFEDVVAARDEDEVNYDERPPVWSTMIQKMSLCQLKTGILSVWAHSAQKPPGNNSNHPEASKK